METNFYNEILNLGLSKKFISLEDLKTFKEKGMKIEDFLNWLNKEKGYLFHGSGTLIPQEEQLISKREVFIFGFWKNLCIFGGLLELQSTRLFVGNFPR